MNPETGPELVGGLQGRLENLPTSIPHHTDFTPLNQIPNKYDEKRPHLYGSDRLAEEMKNMRAQDVVGRLYQHAGRQAHESYYMPDPEDMWSSWYSSNLVGRAPHGQRSLPGRGDTPIRKSSVALGLGMAAAMLGSVPFSHRVMNGGRHPAHNKPNPDNYHHR